MKKIWPVILIIAIIFAISLPISVSYALWQQQSEASLNVEVSPPENVAYWNESLKGIIFVGLNVSKEQTDDIESIKYFAVVGYDHIVDKLEIPNEYSIVIGDEEKTFPVIKIMYPPSDPNFLMFQNGAEYNGDVYKQILKNNFIIEELVLNERLERIENGVFSGCTNLKKITAFGVDDIEFGELSFAACEKLEEIDTERKIRATPVFLESIFINCSNLDLSSISITDPDVAEEP
ncbi:MAG TPA: leucine-rich repeat protein [Clostridiales bacterium]|nr:leucine-rich repeat protein [Clostridiales bacterium]